MKRIIALILALSTIFAFASCGADVTSVTLDKVTVSIPAGETLELKATVAPSTARDKTVEWYSSNDGVVTVDEGRLTAIRIGTAEITVYAEGGFSAVCEVTVVDCLEHSFGEWIEVLKLTCSEEGMKVHTCTRCEYEEEVETAAGGSHRYVGDSCVYCGAPNSSTDTPFVDVIPD